MKVEANVYEVKARELYALEYNGIVFYKDTNCKATGKSILEKWITDKQVKGFNVDDFIKDYPQFSRSQYRRHLDSTISKLITKGLIIQGKGMKGGYDFIVKNNGGV
jgi:hypothetical protein